MVRTAFSSISCCNASILASACVMRVASALSRLASASTESATCFSARPPISATMRPRSCRSVSKALVVCRSVIVVVLLAEATRYIILSAAVVRCRKHARGFAVFDQLAEIHERGEVGHARGLLHVVGHDGDRVVVLKFVDQFLDLGGGDRVERRARLVEQDHLRPHRDGAGDAQPLLLAAGEREPIGVELVLALVPQRGALQRMLHAALQVGFRQPLVQPDAEGDILENRHRERRRLLKHHADLGAQQIEVLRRRQNILIVELYMPTVALVRIEVVHAVEDAQQRGLAATGRTDEGGHLALIQRAIDVLQGTVIAIKEIQVPDRNLFQQTFDAGRCVGDGRYRVRCYAHDDFLCAAKSRAMRLSASTAKVMISAPVQARFCQSLSVLSANWKMTTGRLATGAFMLVLQNWLLSAVNNSGAVSPLIRATASSTPVIMPARAAR